jgi:hypothetical protein
MEFTTSTGDSVTPTSLGHSAASEFTTSTGDSVTPTSLGHSAASEALDGIFIHD